MKPVTVIFARILLLPLIIGATSAVARAGRAYLLMEGAAPPTTEAERRPFGKCLTVDGRVGFMVARLDSGKVLIAGGVDEKTNLHSIAQDYLCDPSTGTLTPVRNMVVPRCCASATLLKDGKVLIAGGMEKLEQGFPVTKAAEVYDPKTRQFTRVADMNKARLCQSATLLQSGRVLIAGGEPLLNRGGTNSAELYEPVTRSFTRTGSMLGAVTCPRTDTLPNGKVAICDGWLPHTGGRMDLEASGCQVYDPSLSTFTFVLDKSQVPKQ